MRGKSEGIRVAVVGVGYWGSRNLRVPRSATGIASVITVDPPFTRIGSESQETDHGVTIYPRIEDALPHAETAWASWHVHPEYEDVAYLRFDHAGLGVRTKINVSWLNPNKVRWITAVGSKRMVV